MSAISRKDVALMLGVALLYFMSAKLGLLLALVDKSVTLFWPASGVALTALLVYGLRIWPGVLLGAVAGNIAVGLVPALEIAIGSTLEAVIGVWLLRRIPGFNRSLVSIRDVFVLLLVAVCSALFSALNGSFWLAFNGIMPWPAYPSTLLFWWMGDALGIILFTPLLLAWLRHKPMPDTPAMRREQAAYFVSLFLLCIVVFSDFGAWLFHTKIGPFTLLPVIVWSAMRFNMRLTALGSGIVFFFSLVGMVCGIGAFTPVTLESIREVWIYNLVMSVTGLVLAVSNYQRRRVSESLELSRAELQRAQAVAQTGSWSMDIIRNELRWSDETCRIFGVPLSNTLTYRTFLDCVHPQDREFVLSSWQATLQGTPHEIEYRLEVGGEIKWVHENAEVDLDDDGHAATIIGTLRDITAHKQAQEEMRLAFKVIEASGEAIMITDADARILTVNQAFTRITGYTQKEVQGRNPRFLASGRHDKEFYRAMWDVVNRDGFWRGEIWDKDKSGRIYPKLMALSAIKDEQGKVIHYMSISVDISERKEAEKNIYQLAYYDALTGLPNRSLLRDRIEQALAAARRDQHKLALMFLDLDRFKYVNDSMGHEAGDKLLQGVAGRLQDAIRDGDTVSRIGGDEFVILLREADADGAARTALKLMTALGEPHDIAEQKVHTHVSIGISVYPDNAEDAETLLKYADVAMYRAKEEGRNNFQCFAPEMNFRSSQLFEMENDLSLALGCNELSLHYQPQLDLQSGRVCGAEALLRWHNPQKGYISPGVFIPIAEETGQIVAIGGWVLRSACEQLAAWRKQGFPHFPVAVNLSIRQLRQSDLHLFISEVLRDAGLQACDLELEITEGIMMGEAEYVTNFWKQMQELGVQLSIDDFGTGYSNLSYLKKLPVDKLKIDQSFVRDIQVDENDDAIVRSIIDLGHQFKLKVIAEGVETEAQLEFLRSNGCDEIQGYYFSRPLPPEEFVKFITKQNNVT